MIEIGLGLVALLSAAAVALGLTDGRVPFPLGRGVIIAATVLGAALIARGAYRLAHKRETADTYALRSLGLAGFIGAVTVVIALSMPSLSEPLNLLKVSGFPLGLYVMGQGILIVFIVLLFVFAGWHSRIDRAGEP